MIKVDAILFDMDGVLVDESQSYRYTIKKTAEFFIGDEIQFLEIQQMKNRGGFNNDWDCTHAIISAHGKDVYHWEVVDKFQEYYLGKNFDGFIKNETWLLKHQVLETLFQQHALGIVTGRPRKEAEFVLSRFEKADYFGALIAIEDTPPGKGKPEPDGIFEAMKKLRARSAVYLGDTVDDISAALSAEIIPIGVLTDNDRSEKQINVLKSHGAQQVLNDVNEIVEILDW
ncbi:MAG: TIGR01548 family HAD-type hydrolase [bacterium]|nr:TIGR01548 family HAD-type hydrolase [bacterium]